MAGEFSTEGSQLALDALAGTSTLTARTMYLVLLTAAPTDATTMATMSEITTPGSDGYDREICAFDAATGADPPVIANTSLITFGPFTTDLANVTHLGLVSAATGTAGDFVMWWAVDTAKDPANGDSITVAAGALTMSLD